MKAVKKCVILSYFMFMLNSNEPTKIVHLQKLANHSMLNGALRNGKWKLVKLWLFNKARKVLIEKLYILVDFA